MNNSHRLSVSQHRRLPIRDPHSYHCGDFTLGSPDMSENIFDPELLIPAVGNEICHTYLLSSAISDDHEPRGTTNTSHLYHSLE